MDTSGHEAVVTQKTVAGEPNASWATLLKNGFTYLSDWRLGANDELELDRDAPKKPGVYAFVLAEQVVYIGVTLRTLHTRMADYRRGDRRQKTSSHIKSLIIASLHAGQKVRVLVATPPDIDWRGLPVVTALGLEAGLISAMRPKWNRQGKR